MTQSSSVRAGLLVLLVSLALVGGATSSALGAAAVSDEGSPDTHSVAAAPHVAQQTTPAPVNNSTLRHRNPDEVASEDRLDELQGLLGGRLTDRLSESSVQLSEAQYEQARSVLGDAYLDQLGKYGDVAGERGDDNATSAVETFNETRNTQREYSETVEEFRETVEEYEEARANGNEERARQLARDAVRLGREAARQSDRLNESYGQLEQATGADLDTTREEIETVQSNVDDNRTEVERATFVSTTLTVRVADTQGSFTDPFVISGELTSEDGPVSDRRIRLAVGSQNGIVTTNASGAFALTYRPTVLPANASNLTVRYVPQETSAYSASNDTVPVDVEQVTARARLDTSTTDTAFGESVAARGTLTVANESVGGLPLALRVDGVQVAGSRTAGNGSFDIAGALPAAPRSGTQTLTVGAAFEDRAVAVEPVSTSVQIRETATALSATVSDDNGTAATAVSGRLTAAGRPVADQRLVVTVAGDRVGTTRTDALGRYRVRLDGEAGLATVRFDGAGTNLASAEASVQLPTERADSDAGGSAGAGSNQLLPRFFALLESDPLAALTTPLGLVVSGVVVGLAGLGLVAARRRYLAGAAGSPAAVTDDDGRAVSSESPSDTTTTAGTSSADPFESAVAAFDDGLTDDAVVDAYAAVRQALTSTVASDQARTHWQFFDACVAAGVDAEPLRTITEAYETARYGAESSSESVTNAALAAARSLVGRDEMGASESAEPSDD